MSVKVGVEELAAGLTVDEKASLTAGEDVWHLPAIPSIGLGRLTMSDGPSGIRGARRGTRRSLAFACGIAAGATWDVELLGRYGAALAAEAKVKGVHVLLGPTICIPRTPLAGRTFESFSEDPWLTARATVAYIRAVQAAGVACCVKHFACNDQEFERLTISSEVDERTLREIHLPAFEAAVKQAEVWSIMSAYNKVNGTWCGEHPVLLGEILKGEWAFDGVVISDWGGTHTTAEAALAGLDIEMPGPGRHLGEALAGAVRAGRVPGEVLEGTAQRILRLAERTGAIEGTAVEEGEEDDEARRRLARELTAAGAVLLTNDGLLPFAKDLRSLAVIGPNSNFLEVGGGGSSAVFPLRRQSLVDELRARLPETRVVHEEGCRLDRGIPVLERQLVPDGFDVEYFANPRWEGPVRLAEKLWGGAFGTFGDPAPGVSLAGFSVRAAGRFRPDRTGEWQLSLAATGASRVLLDGEVIIDNLTPDIGETFWGFGSSTVSAVRELTAGAEHDLVVESATEGAILAGFRLGALRPADPGALDRAVAAAADADAVLLVVGGAPDWESEGFDRETLHLIGGQEELIARVLEANPRTAVAVNQGAPVAMPWVDHAAANLTVWYPGEEGAPALADIVTGRAEPGGRLPITFPKRIEDTPAHGWFPGSEGKVVYGEKLLVGYRHYDANDLEPLFPFGHGLSYTSFELGEPAVEAAGSRVTVTVPVTNTGDRAGSEVVQLYVAGEAAEGEPPQQLKAFAKVGLAAGASGSARLALDESSFSYWDVEAHGWRVRPGVYELRVGRSSRDIRHRVSITIV